MSDQQVKYTITADASQANSELAKVDKAASSLVNQERALADSIARATKAIAAEEKSAAAAAKAIADHGAESVKAAKAVAAHERAVEQSAKAMLAQQRATENLAAATKKAADESAKAAGSTRNVGQVALEASRGLEDLQYGIGGVVNNIPSLVMALGGGAGLTAAISLGAVAVNQLVKNFGAVDPAAKEASQKAREHVKGLRDEIEGLSQDLRSIQVGAERAAMEAQAEIVGRAAQAAQAALSPLGGIDRFERLKDRTDLPLTITENVQKASAAMSELDLEMSKLAGMRRIQVEKDSQRKIDLAVDAANAETERETASNKSSLNNESELAKLRYDIFVAGLDSEDKALKEVNDARRKDAKAQKEQEAKDLADSFKEMDRERALNQKAADKEKLKQEKKSLKDIEKEQEKHAKQNEQYATQAVGIVTGATQQYVEARIKGEKNAEAAFAASIMAQAGQALVSYGIQAVGRGVLEASSVVTAPLAPASFAAGAALIGAGIGLGGIGAGIGQLSAGGTIGKELPDKKAAKDKGASPGRNGGGSGGGPLVVNVAYGAGGPLPEDTAREIQKAVDTGRRRGGR